ERFLAANPKGPEATKVTVELARLEVSKGEALFTQAVRHEDPKSREGLKRQAEGYFARAAEELQKAAALVPTPEEKVAVLFERGKTLFDQANTHNATAERAVLVDKARAAFEEVQKLILDREKAGKPDKGPPKGKKDPDAVRVTRSKNPTLHLARAW